MASKRFLPVLLIGIVMFAVGCLVGLLVHAAIKSPGTTEFDSDVSYSGVFVSASMPDEIVRGKPYQIALMIEELEGQPRTIIGVRFEGLMLTRALQYCFTEPPADSGTNNIGDGWVDNLYSLPLPARSTLTITIEGDALRAGPAHGTVTVSFDDGSDSSIPIKYEIVKP